MKCPRCHRDIDDRASFCGYCGMVIAPPPQAAPPQMTPPQAAPPQMAPPQAAPPQAAPPQAAPPQAAPPQAAPPKKKKRVGLIALLICSVLAVAAGSTLGFMSVKGIIDWKRFIPSRSFAWTDSSEGVTAQVVSLDSPDDPDDPDDSKDKPAMADPEETPAPQEPQDPEDPQDPEPSESQPGSDDPDSEPSEPPDESEPPGQTEEPEGLHYLKYAENTLLIVDDMARVLPEESILEIMEKMQQLSGLSSYSIMAVFVDGLSGVPIEEVAGGYFTDAMASNQGEDLPLSMDGLVLLADLADGQFFLSAFGDAQNQLTDAQIDAILGDVGPYTGVDELAAAVLGILELIPY